MFGFENPLAGQGRNWPCWVAVAFATGVGVYFSLPIEPGVALAVASLTLGLGATVIGLRRPAILVPALFVLLLAAGFAVAQLRALSVAAPVLAEDLDRVVITGDIEEIELQPTGQRVTLRNLRVTGISPSRTPARARLKVAADQPELRAGQRVTGRAALSAPLGPVTPGAFDFRRDAYFQRLGAIGFSFGKLRVIDPASEIRAGQNRWLDGAAQSISNLRSAIARRIMEQLPERSGALAAALIVGDQRAIPQSDVDAMRDSGLAHILSISGLHIGLAAGLVFFSLRAVLALIPALALDYPIKKWAAAAAILAAFAYAILAGWTTPTQRSCIMAGLAFLAILVDRSPISLRLVAVAALIVLVLRPEALVGASFQMSFAAVFLLIVVFDKLGAFFMTARRSIGSTQGWLALPAWFGMVGLWMLATALSSLVASLATLPFVILHFDRIAVYGIIANAIAVPLTGFWIMPAAVLVLLSMPFGLESWPLALMGAGCEMLLWIAGTVAIWPGASVLVPAPPGWALPVSAIGVLAIGLFGGWWRWLGVVLILAGLSAGYLAATPVLLVAPQGDLVGFRAPDGGLVLSKGRGAKIARETWLRREARGWAGDIESMQGSTDWLACGVDHCRWRGAVELSVVLEGDVRSVAPCKGAKIVIIPDGRDLAGCSGLARIIDRDDLRAAGALAIYVEGNGLRITTSADMTGRRPWTAPFDAGRLNNAGSTQ